MRPLRHDWTLRPDEERAAFEWWLDRRSPVWSVALHTARCGGAELMFWLTRFGVRHWATWAPRRPPFWMATAHTLCRIDPEWPAGHYVIDLT